MSALTDTIVDALYRGILGRPPEPQALPGASALLERQGVEASLLPMVQQFIASPEFRHRVNVVGLLAEPPPLRRPDQPPYRHAISLGTNCYPSQILKYQGLKRFSGPFDWVFSSVPMVEHCLRDDFRTLLDPAHIVPVPPAERVIPGYEHAEHVFYRDQFGVQRMFNHHDPTTEDGYRYVQRCVDRLRRVMQQDEKALYVLTVRDHPDSLRDVLSLSAVLQGMTRNADLLAVAITEPLAAAAGFGMHTVLEQPGLLVMRFDPTSKLLAVSFEQPFDDMLVHRLIRSFRFDLTS